MSVASQQKGDADAKKPDAECRLHWWTAATYQPIADVEKLLGHLGEPERPGGRGHPHRRVHESGTVLYCGSDRKDQPLVIEATGDVCDYWAPDLVGWTIALDGYVTRADVAVDLEPATLARKRLRQLRRDFAAGRCETRMRSGPDAGDDLSMEFHANALGETVVFGGPSSNLRLRVYDERGPLRLEVQYRPAREIGEELPERVHRLGYWPVWRQLVRKAVIFNHAWYQGLLEGPGMDLPATQKGESELDEAICYLRDQYGNSLWALQQLGYTLDDLATKPEKPRGALIAKFAKWSATADRQGIDNSKLQAEIKQWQGTRSRQERSG